MQYIIWLYSVMALGKGGVLFCCCIWNFFTLCQGAVIWLWCICPTNAGLYMQAEKKKKTSHKFFPCVAQAVANARWTRRQLGQSYYYRNSRPLPRYAPLTKETHRLKSTASILVQLEILEFRFKLFNIY